MSMVWCTLRITSAVILLKLCHCTIMPRKCGLRTCKYRLIYKTGAIDANRGRVNTAVEFIAMGISIFSIFTKPMDSFNGELGAPTNGFNQKTRYKSEEIAWSRADKSQYLQFEPLLLASVRLAVGGLTC